MTFVHIECTIVHITYLQFCWDHGGYLIELKEEYEEEEIDIYLEQGLCYWIGLTDKALEGTFIIR